jgi:serine/threonine protein kinase
VRVSLPQSSATVSSSDESLTPFLSVDRAGRVFLRSDEFRYNNVPSRFPMLSSSGLDLLQCLLAYDPSKRLTARYSIHLYLYLEIGHCLYKVSIHRSYACQGIIHVPTPPHKLDM